MSSNKTVGPDVWPQPRVAVFIDGSNLYHSLEENCKRYDVNFSSFADRLCGKRTLYRIYYYNVVRDADRNPQAYQYQQKFLTALHNTPYLEVRLGSYKLRGDVAVEKGVDIMLATDLLRMAWDNVYDVAILVSGDGDFAYAVQSVKNLGKHVEVAAFTSNLSGDLANIADSVQPLSLEYFADLWSSKRTSAKSGSQGRSTQRRGWRFGRFRKNGEGSD